MERVPELGAVQAESQQNRWQRAGALAARATLPGIGAVLGAGLMLATHPYETEVADIPVEVAMNFDSDIVVDTGIFGKVTFGDVTALPIGLTIEPDVDLEVLGRLTNDTQGQVNEIIADVRERQPELVGHALWQAGTGLLAGGAAGTLLLGGVAALARPETRRRVAGAAVAGTLGGAALLGGVAGIGALSYHPPANEYSMSGLLGDLKAVPGQVAAVNEIDFAAGQKHVRAIAQIQELLLNKIESAEQAPTALNILLISDIHMRAAAYPSIQPFIVDNDIDLIINTGDEINYGLEQEFQLSGKQRAEIEKTAALAPMIWVKGNHDSVATAQIMDKIPGVTVLNEQYIDAFGLTIGGLADSRNFDGKYEITDDSGQIEDVDKRAPLIAPENRFDIMLSHEPVANARLVEILGSDRVAMTIAGHGHKQTLEVGETIAIMEGTTGAEGLLGMDGEARQHFSVLRVGQDCQFLELERYNLPDPLDPGYGDSSVAQYAFEPREMTEERTCDPAIGLDSEPTSWTIPQAASTVLAEQE
jgi:predicted phosphodiesterase